MNGGEDYQLLFTAQRETMDQVLALLPEPAVVVGEALAGPPGQVVIVDDQGRESQAQTVGWDHFA